ncbi:hypothetical protein [Leifsonia sp. fls2-241-R2A-40a]|uniref:hypothetical protein n=1 Tax=Leifsonia sp. fls2-241-R2A-40a TaxID=3040290 RepID=UPI00254C0AEC|nr:hypothetical protein [Leifsonia sp. fls2-241-R2A-40a]
MTAVLAVARTGLRRRAVLAIAVSIAVAPVVTSALVFDHVVSCQEGAAHQSSTTVVELTRRVHLPARASGDN